MPSKRVRPGSDACLRFTDSVLKALRNCHSEQDLARLMEAVTSDMGFQYYALIHHDDLRTSPPDRVHLKRYPLAVTERLIAQNLYGRDPVIRACLNSPSAFLWSDLANIIHLSPNDRERFAFGARAGLNEGITVPYARLGDPMGSCTFAGARFPERAARYLGVAQMIGVFAFQAALHLIGLPTGPNRNSRKLHPRPRDCIVLAGKGLSNKEIARALSLAPRTVDGYLTEARRLFEAHDRTELVISAVLAGEVGLHELRRQPE